MRAAAVALILALALPLASPRPAAAQEAGGVFREFFRADRIVRTILDEIAANPAVTRWLVAIGTLAAALFFLYNLHMGLITQQPGWVTDAILRAAVVGTVLANLPFVAEVIVSLHRAFSAIGDVVFNALGGPVRYEDVIARLNEAQGYIRAAISQFTFWEIAAFFSALLMQYIPFLIFMLFLGFAIALYNFLLLSSYLMLGIAVIMIPISIACFATRSMQRFTYEWFQVVLHSALIAMLTKAAVGLVANVAVLDTITAYADRIIEVARSGAPAQDVLRAAALRIEDIVPVVLGAIVGVFTLLNIQGVASAFVGRVESVAGAIAGMYFTMRAAPAVARPVAAAIAATPAAVHSAYAAAGAAIDRASISRLGEWAHGQLLEFSHAVGTAAEAVRTGYGWRFDRTLPGPASLEEYRAYREVISQTERYYQEAEADLRRMGARQAPATEAGEVEPSEEHMPTEPIWDPNWPPRE